MTSPNQTSISAPLAIENPNSLKKLKSKLSQNKILLIICFATFFASFDFTIFIFLADSLSVNFFAASINGVSNKFKLIDLFAIGYIERPFGGFLFARYGDTQGRKPALNLGLSILFWTSLAVAFLPTYSQIGVSASILLITVRLIQGAAFANQFGLS